MAKSRTDTIARHSKSSGYPVPLLLGPTAVPKGEASCNDLRITTDSDSGDNAGKLRGAPELGEHEDEERQWRLQETLRLSRLNIIEAFKDTQRRSHQWISLHKLAYLCGTRNPILSEDVQERHCSNALLSLLESALAGEFNTEGASRLLLAHPDYPIEDQWLINPENAPSEAFVTEGGLRGHLSVPHKHHNGTDRRKTAVAGFIIAHCFVPVGMAVRWLQTREPPVLPPPEWLRVNATSGIELDSAIRAALHQGIKDFKAENPRRQPHAKEQVSRAMKILQDNRVTSKTGGLRKRVEKIAEEDEFKGQRNPVGVRYRT